MEKPNKLKDFFSDEWMIKAVLESFTEFAKEKSWSDLLNAKDAKVNAEAVKLFEKFIKSGIEESPLNNISKKVKPSIAD